MRNWVLHASHSLGGHPSPLGSINDATPRQHRDGVKYGTEEGCDATRKRTQRSMCVVSSHLTLSCASLSPIAFLVSRRLINAISHSTLFTPPRLHSVWNCSHPLYEPREGSLRVQDAVHVRHVL